MGVKSLDTYDDKYVPNYNSADDSTSYNTAHGFNRHDVSTLFYLF